MRRYTRGERRVSWGLSCRSAADGLRSSAVRAESTAEVWLQGLTEVELAVGRLPHEEAGQPLLAGTDQRVRVRLAASVEARGDVVHGQSLPKPRPNLRSRVSRMTSRTASTFTAVRRSPPQCSSADRGCPRSTPQCTQPAPASESQKSGHPPAGSGTVPRPAAG